MSSFCSDDCFDYDDDSYGFVGDGVNECSDKFNCACKWCSWTHLQWFMHENNETYYGYDCAEEIMYINNYMTSGKMLSDNEFEYFIWENEFDFGPPNFLTKNDVEKKANRRRIKKNRNKKLLKFAQLNLDFSNPNTYPAHQLEHKYLVNPSCHGYTKSTIFAPHRIKKYNMKFRDRNVNSKMLETL